MPALYWRKSCNMSKTQCRLKSLKNMPIRSYSNQGQSQNLDMFPIAYSWVIFTVLTELEEVKVLFWRWHGHIGLNKVHQYAVLGLLLQYHSTIFSFGGEEPCFNVPYSELNFSRNCNFSLIRHFDLPIFNMAVSGILSLNFSFISMNAS